MDDPEKLKGTSSILHQALCIIWNLSVNSNRSFSPEAPNLGQNRWFLEPCDLANWCMTLKNNRAPLLYHVKLCASFQIHRWSQTWVTVRKCSIRFKIGDFFVPRDLEIWWMTLKNNRAPLLYYIKLFAAFQSHWHIQTGVTVWKRAIRVKIGHIFVSRDIENWGMNLKNNRAPLLCCFKLCASFHSHWWIQTGVTVRKRPNWVKIDILLAVWPWNLTGDLAKQ